MNNNWDYDDENFDDDYPEEDELDIEDLCCECGRPAIDQCICGNPLCHMHFEIQAGLCKQTSWKEHEKIMEELEER